MEKIILFGAGEAGRAALAFYGSENVDYFADNNKNKIGTPFLGKLVIGIDSLVEMSKTHKIVISSSIYHAEMSFQLESAGILDFSVFSTNRIVINNYDNNKVYFENGRVIFDFAQFGSSHLLLEGRVILTELSDDFQIILNVNGKPENVKTKILNKPLLEEGALEVGITSFECEIPLNSCERLEFQINYENGGAFQKKPAASEFFPVEPCLETAYCYKDGHKLFFANNGGIVFERCNYWNLVKTELRFLRSLAKSKKSRKAIWTRLLHHIAKPFFRKDIWLIFDRSDMGGDNGEALFRHLTQIKDRNIKPIFCVNKKAEDFARMKQTGKVIHIGGSLFKFYVLLGAKRISSHIHYDIGRVFGSDAQYYRDLLSKSKYVFLQHGITENDVSSWLNRYIRNFAIFTTSTFPEHSSILRGKYFYSEKQVKLTGFARHDLLYNDPKKYITIMPTWRKQLCIPKAGDAGGSFAIISDFEMSDYFKFYNRLLCNTRLLQQAKHLGYRLCFAPHFNLKDAIGLFSKNDDALIFAPGTKSYKEIFAESDMILTDFSSVAFDFAYLRKPVLYCHFDAEDFFSGEHHCEKGYFDFTRDGFGEVETTLEAVIDRIIEYMQNGCVLKEKYRNRIDETFAFNDKNNCERITQAIKSLEGVIL